MYTVSPESKPQDEIFHHEFLNRFSSPVKLPRSRVFFFTKRESNLSRSPVRSSIPETSSLSATSARIFSLASLQTWLSVRNKLCRWVSSVWLGEENLMLEADGTDSGLKNSEPGPIKIQGIQFLDSECRQYFIRPVLLPPARLSRWTEPLIVVTSKMQTFSGIIAPDRAIEETTTVTCFFWVTTQQVSSFALQWKLRWTLKRGTCIDSELEGEFEWHVKRWSHANSR